MELRVEYATDTGWACDCADFSSQSTADGLESLHCLVGVDNDNTVVDVHADKEAYANRVHHNARGW